MPRVVGVYAALLALWYVWLAFRVIRRRYATRISLGHGQDRLLERAVRAHANFAEWVPLPLLLLLMLDLSGAGAGLLHALGAALLLGRVLHGIGILREPEMLPLRSVGMVLTLGALTAAAIALLAGAFV